MRQLRLTQAGQVTALYLTPVSRGVLRSLPLYATAHRGYGCTSVVLAEHVAHHSRDAKRRDVLDTPSTAATTGSAGTASSSAAAATAQRVAAIRRTEGLLRWLRRLVVPAFSLFGLYVLRPTEGHFLRYVAERRHLDADFNAWFPPVSVSGGGGGEGVKKSSTSTAAASTASHASSKLSDADLAAAFRTPQDREWAARWFHYKKGSEDEERVARRRLLFARDREYLADDTVVERIRSTEAQRVELRAQREHPPMHLLGEQLDAMAEESRKYIAAKQAAASTSSLTAAAAAAAAAVSPPALHPPQVYIRFNDCCLYATATIEFRDRMGTMGGKMHFVGACGMMWRQVS